MDAVPRLPVLFVSHGSPMFAVEPGEAGAQLRALGQRLRPHVQAVLVLSPHWMTPGLELMAHAKPDTWHDFGGFAPELYGLRYPSPGAPLWAARLQRELAEAGWPATLAPQRPYDHGAWVPLLHLFPQADVPVFQLSLPASADPQTLYALGQALAHGPHQGLLLLASGSMTHNLREFFYSRVAPDAPALPYVAGFAAWVEQTLQAQDLPRLLDYRRQAPDAARAHPTDEHFLPLYWALGAAAWGQAGATAPQYLTHEVRQGHLAMDSLLL